MRQVNNQVKEALNISLTERKVESKKVELKNQTFIRKRGRDYTKAFVWILIGAITVAVWTTIYNLIF